MAMLNNQRVPGKPYLIEKIRCSMAFGVFYFRIKQFTCICDVGWAKLGGGFRVELRPGAAS